MTTSPRSTPPPTAAPKPPAEDELFAALRDALRPAYQLLRRLGEGGMGAVYLAREPALKRDVAVKVMLPWLASDPTARARFDREAQAVAAIAHPHVINIFGTGELADGTPYFVMQFVHGRGLDARLAADGPLSMREARRVLSEVAAALAAAHRRGIVHRDIKTANVLQDGESGSVIVTDFGIAAVRDSAEQPDLKLTQPEHGSPGTPAYMAPEQLLGEPTTEASDVYAFGLLAYELLTGEGPFRATSPHEMAAAQLRDTPPPLSTLRPDMDPELELLVGGCLAKQPGERPTAVQLVQRLPPADALSLEWPPPGLERLAGRLPSLSRRIGLGSGLLAASLLGLATADPAGGTLLPVWLLVVTAIAGAVWLLATIVGARVFVAGTGAALRRGYPWTAVLEVAADRRGDTGTLITGLREYAALSRATRSRLRYGRVAGASCGFLAGVAPLLALVWAVRVAARGATPAAMVLVVAVPSLLLLAAAGALRYWEHRVARLTVRRRRKAQPAAVTRPVVQAWNESLRAAEEGQPLGGRVPHPLAARLVLIALLLVTAAGTLAVLPVVSIPAIGSVFFATAIPKLTGAQLRVRTAQSARPWAPPPAPEISAEAAGRAFHVLTMAGIPGYAATQFGAPDDSLPGFLLRGDSAGLFPFPPAQLLDSVLRLAARRALTPPQRRFLARAAAHPGWPYVRMAGRAARADIVGTRHTRETLESTPLVQVAIPRLGNLRDAGYAAGLAAAHHLAEGREREAEAVLRDAIGLGLNLMDRGVWLIETLVGAALVRQSFDRLETLYDATGRSAEAMRIRAARDAAREQSERMAEIGEAAEPRRLRSTAAQFRDGLDRLMRDSTLPTSFRREFVHQYQFLPCASARDLVFGSGAAVDSTLAIFERQTVHSRSDSLWYRKSREAPWGASRSVVARLAALDARLLGNPRIAACGALLAG